LCHLRSAFENLFSALVDSGNTDDKVAIAHSGVLDLDHELISVENLSDKIDIVAVHTNEFTILLESITHMSTRYGTPLATTVSTYCLVAALVNMPCIRVPGKEAKAGK
jgi:hypothetical protein